MVGTEAEASRLLLALDRLEIADLMARYCRGMDRCDIELLKSIYHPDATETHGAFSGSYLEFIDNYVPPLWQATTVGFHSISNSIVEIDGHVARAETYAFVVSRSHVVGQGGSDTFMGARYLDRVERRVGGPWLIADRTVVFDWGHVMEFEGDPPFPPASYLTGRRGTSDLSYQTFGLLSGVSLQRAEI